MARVATLSERVQAAHLVHRADASCSAGAFALEYMRTERAELLRFSDRPYLLDILDDDAPEHVCVACAQSGKTVTYLSKILWRLAFPQGRPSRTAIYTFPTEGDVQQFSAARAKRMIRASPFLSERIGDLDNVSIKQLSNGSTVYFKGTWTDRAAISVPADIRVHDELDRSKPDTLQIYSDRLRNSDDPRTYLFSTPTIPGFGISREWERSDQREWMWECWECGRDQIFAPMDGSVPWVANLDMETRQWRCQFCGWAIEHENVMAGRWVAQAPQNAGVSGYHITGIMPPYSGADRLLGERDKANSSGAEELWLQGHIGLPAVAAEGRITPDMIRFGDWPNAEVSDKPTYAGLDQGRKLDFIAGDGGGRIVAVHRYDDWSQVAAAMQAFKVSLLVADSSPDARPVQELIARFPGRVMLADYSLQAVTDDHPWARQGGVPRVRLQRTAVLDMARQAIIMGADGGDVFPRLPLEQERVLVGQLCASVRTIEQNAAGIQKAVWRETADDHFRHAHAYYVVASRMGTRFPPIPDFMRGPLSSSQAVDPRTGEVQTVTPRTVEELQMPDGVVGPDGQPAQEVRYPKLPAWHRQGP